MFARLTTLQGSPLRSPEPLMVMAPELQPPDTHDPCAVAPSQFPTPALHSGVRVHTGVSAEWSWPQTEMLPLKSMPTSAITAARAKAVAGALQTSAITVCAALFGSLLRRLS